MQQVAFYRDPIVMMWNQRSVTLVPDHPASLMKDGVIHLQELRQFSEFVLMFTGIYKDEDYSESFDTQSECEATSPDELLFTISGRIREAPPGVNPWHDLHDTQDKEEAELLLSEYAKTLRIEVLS